MREIKFRAWIPDEKRMFFPSSISWKHGIMWACDVMGENRYETSIEESDLMQFTGLRDCKGKEIYEGDILSSGEEDCPRICQVEYRPARASFYVSYKPHGYDALLSTFYQLNIDFVKVIGNIYQNQKLLKR